MTMTSKDAFAQALRAEIEAVVARYEALSKAHQEALGAAREQEASKLRGELSALVAERERGRAAEAELKAKTAQAVARAEQLSAELREARELLEKERRAAREAQARVEGAAAEAKAAVDRAAKEARDQIERERKASREAIERAEAQLAEARQRAERLSADLEGARAAAASLGEAFAGERAFIEAASGLEGSPLHEALKAVLGCEPLATPAVYAELKSRRPDAVMTQLLKERGRTSAFAPLSDRERAALKKLAEASGCELIVPEHGQRFSPQSMDKASTVSDPAEEGNVVDCLVPGLRLAGTEGALVFPKVLVATGLALRRKLGRRRTA